jgi:hypothetical protein
MPNRYLAEVMRVEEALLSVLEDSLDFTAGSWSSLHVQSEVLRAKLVRMHREIGQAWDELEVLCGAGLLEQDARLLAEEGAMVEALAKWAA